jgi:hypothetical protein
LARESNAGERKIVQESVGLVSAGFYFSMAVFWGGFNGMPILPFTRLFLPANIRWLFIPLLPVASSTGKSIFYVCFAIQRASLLQIFASK